jgi:hypothetical protein
MSVALCLLEPLSVGLEDESSRCDSASRRCSARSFFRLADSEASSSEGREVLDVLVPTEGVLSVGGLELCRGAVSGV